ncbi:MAG: ribonuclease III [Candidatus Wallbacteria bacterium HGW-Wallbacteria-1]|jgi:ribonuclease-3 family protein|uniref:Ribonuclease III n=1 Tax=Candidatus Wallbacteria bacterium HGW-Wallbacteria-1 TaxID=2013854 RepID=A0A2N1PSZ4_9BACT|nr:MAG: ribonuclease III [Candidatus Wallbacteria bacterium HGW-Wallbacteria-1]
MSDWNPTQKALQLAGTTETALIGDSVYSLFARTLKVARGKGRGDVNYESAAVQAVVSEFLQPYLSDEEILLFRRGRNNSRMRVPRNCRALDYRHATGLEYLLGTLYLSGQRNRLRELFELMEKALQEE